MGGRGRRVVWVGLWIVLGSTGPARAGEAVDVGHYRIERRGGGLLGLGCQPRTELYVRDPADPTSAPVYLGTCGTPRVVTEQLKLSSDPSCFAIAEDGLAIVYFHRPQWCGAGERARSKPGGVYRHRVGQGEQWVYTDRQVGMVWSRAPVPAPAIRVSWSSASPSPSGAVCSQRLLISASGPDVPEGEPKSAHGCRGQATPAAASTP